MMTLVAESVDALRASGGDPVEFLKKFVVCRPTLDESTHDFINSGVLSLFDYCPLLDTREVSLHGIDVFIELPESLKSNRIISSAFGLARGYEAERLCSSTLVAASVMIAPEPDLSKWCGIGSASGLLRHLTREMQTPVKSYEPSAVQERIAQHRSVMMQRIDDEPAACLERSLRWLAVFLKSVFHPHSVHVEINESQQLLSYPSGAQLSEKNEAPDAQPMTVTTVGEGVFNGYSIHLVRDRPDDPRVVDGIRIFIRNELLTLAETGLAERSRCQNLRHRDGRTCCMCGT